MPINWNQLPPPQEGDLTPFWKPTTNGESVEGVIVDTRVVHHNEYGDAPCVDVQIASGAVVPILFSTASLYRQIHALYEANPADPQVGGMIRVTYLGMSGRAKLFDVQYAPPAGGAPAAAPAAAPAPAAPPAAPQGFGSGAAAPWSNQPAAPAPAPAAAPWGQ